MKNAHERFGKLAYQRRTEKTATNIRVFLDAFVGEEQGRAHWFRQLAAMWRSARWLQPSRMETHLP
jgi:hypothetical protein